jgi:hypothetical protein
MFILTQDDSGHWYVIPADKSAEFDAWVETDGQDGYDPPVWAVEVNGAYSRVRFPSFVIE